MPLLPDHFVILVPDLQAASAGYASQGFTVQQGGTHADGRTHNALVGFADGSYLELIAFRQAPGDHRWARHATAGWQGYVDWALLPPDVPSVVQRLRAGGLGYAGPHDGGRVRPDGAVLQWQIGTPPTPDLPFFCGDVTPRALRVREGDVRVHANGVCGVAAITLVVNDLEASLARYAVLLGRDAPVQALPGAGLRSATLPLGEAQLVLVQPLGSGGGAQALRDVLARRGEGVIGLALRSTVTTAPHELPQAATQHAAITLLPA